VEWQINPDTVVVESMDVRLAVLLDGVLNSGEVY
jgi:hypothetical protein